MSDIAKTVMTKIDGSEYYFSFAKFCKEFDYYVHNRKMQEGKYTIAKCREELALCVNVSPEAVKQWKGRHNGPSSLAIVEKMAEFFGIDYMDLLVCKEGETTMAQDTSMTMELSSSERAAVLKVYEMAVDFIYFAADRYKNALIDPLLENNRVFYEQRMSRLTKIYRHIDNNGLQLSEETRKKLYRIVGEMSKCQNPIEESLGRWRRLNHKSLLLQGIVCKSIMKVNIH